MEKVSYYEYPESSSKSLTLSKGIHQINFNFEDSFLPGKYLFTTSDTEPSNILRPCSSNIPRLHKLLIAPILWHYVQRDFCLTKEKW